MIEYTWRVTGANSTNKPVKGTLNFAAFTVVAKDTVTGETASDSGAVDLLPPTDSGKIVAVDKLTQDDLVKFVKAALSVPGKDSPEVYEKRLADQLAARGANAQSHTFE